MKNINTNPQKTKSIIQSFAIIAIIMLLIATTITLIMTRFRGESKVVTEETIESLIAENEDNPASTKYLVTDNCISRVYPETQVQTFVTNFSEGEVVKVYKDKTCTQEVTDGFVVSGMYAKYQENNKVFEISVLGDINEKQSKTEGGAVLFGDGVLNQIELTRDIRSCVDDEWKIDEEVEKKSGDVNCNNQIDELAADTIINYIVFGELNIPEVKNVEKPTIEVIRGNLNTNTVYTSDVTLRINENEEDALKSIYKITGDKNQDYKEFTNGEEVVLNENGLYKVTAYTYGTDENKSKREYMIINIDKTANYQMEYYIENVDGSYSKVDEDTKTVEGIIGNIVEIESKRYTGYELDVDNVNGKLQGAVLDDGSLVLKAYYKRKLYTYSFVTGENIRSINIQKGSDSQVETTSQDGKTISITGKWGEKVNASAVVEEQEGYTITWKNWKNTENANDVIQENEIEITIGLDNKEYRAIATKSLIEYGITYELNNGKLADGITNPSKYDVETQSFTLNEPTRPGYTFEGWTGSGINVATKPVTITTGSTGNRQYIANWAPITNTPYAVEHYKETLSTGEYVLAETQNLGGTTDVEVSAVPKEYTGFILDENNENAKPSGVVTADGELVLKLYYTRQSYDLTLVAGNYITSVEANDQSTQNSKTISLKYDQSVEISATLENIEGYNYLWKQWELLKNNSGEEATIISEQTKTIKMPANNITLTAIADRSLKIYPIEYELNGGTLPQGVVNPETYTVESQDLVINNLQDGTKLGYNFAGWTGSNGQTPSKNVVLTSGSTGSKSYIANWEKAEFDYYVEYYYDNVKDESKTETHSATYEEIISDYTDKVIVGYELKENPTAIKISYDTTKNVLKVYYVRKTYTLTLDKDDNIASVTGGRDYKYGDEAQINAILKEQEGYNITWNKWESETPTLIEDNSNQTAQIIIPDGDITLKATANKDAIEYSIDYMLNGGELSESNLRKYTIETQDFNLNIPTKQGYVFAGWTGGTESPNPGETGNITNPTTNVTIKQGSMGDRVYTANWVGDVKTPYTVKHYKENLDGTFTLADTVEAEGTTDENAIASKKTYTGYVFDSANLNNKLEGKVKPDGSLVLEVYYKRVEYTFNLIAGENISLVSYNVVDGIGMSENVPSSASGTNIQGTFKFGTKFEITAVEKTQEGHTITWNGWLSSNSSLVDNQDSKNVTIDMPIGNIALTAKATKTTNSYRYKIEYYYDGQLDENETEPEDEETKAQFGSEISSYIEKVHDGYEFDREENKPLLITVNENNNIMKIFYKLINYTIIYNLNGGSLENGQTNPEIFNVKSATITLNKPIRQGYTFTGWTGTNGVTPVKELVIQNGSIGNREYNANWEANTNTKYTVKHYTENLDGTYELKETETLEGTTDTEATAVAKTTYVGFEFDANNSNNIVKGNIESDESLVLELYYSRKSYDLVLSSDSNISEVIFNENDSSQNTLTKKVKFEEEVSINATIKESDSYIITWDKWVSNKPEIVANKNSQNATIEMPAEDIEFTATTTQTPIQFNITYVYNNGELPEGIENPTKYNVETENFVLNQPVKQGYVFAGWTGGTVAADPGTTGNITIPQAELTIEKGSKGNRTYTANWVGDTRTDYKVEHYLENLDGTYTLQDTDSLKGTTDTEVTAEPKTTYVGYEFDEDNIQNFLKDNVKPDGSLVLKVYYKLINYRITYELNNGSLEEGQTNPEFYNVKSNEIILKNPIRQGYSFDGWTGTGYETKTIDVSIPTGSVGDREYNANWEANQDTAYTVKHYIEKLDGTYELKETETLEGTTDTEVTAVAKTTYVGFEFDTNNSNNIVKGNVEADESLVLELYYARKSYDLVLSADNNISEVTFNGTESSQNTLTKKVKFEEEVSINATIKESDCYTISWDKWVSNKSETVANKNNQNATLEMPAEDIEFTATTTQTPISFTITYDLKDGSFAEGVTNREQYNVETDNFTLNQPVKQGYVFAGWTGGTTATDPGTTGNITIPQEELTIEKGSKGNRTYTANWVGDTRTDYKVEHYLENLDGTYTLQDTDSLKGTTDSQVTVEPKTTYVGYEFDENNSNNLVQDEVKPDGSLVLKLYYNRIEYTLKIVAGSNIETVYYYSLRDGMGAGENTANQASGTEIEGKFKYGAQINISADLKEETGHTITWSKWESNDRTILVDQAAKDALIGMPIGDVTLTAKATNTVNSYNYKVEYYYDNELDESKTFEASAQYGRTISTYPNKNIDGFEFEKDENKGFTVSNIEENNIIKVYYKHINYSINYILNDGVVDGDNPETYNVRSNEITLINPTREGYTFLGWTGTDLEDKTEHVTISQGSLGNREYTANWLANTDTRYTVEHYTENLDGTYTKVEVENELYGTTGSEVFATPKTTYTGFEFDDNNDLNIPSGTITGDGNLVLKLYYARKSYELKLIPNENIGTVTFNETESSQETITKQVKYEQQVTISATEKVEENYEYTWTRWTSNKTSLVPNQSNKTTTITMPADSIELTATASKAGKQYEYSVEYYYDNVLDATKTVTSNARFNTQVNNYSRKDVTGYEFDKVEGLPLTITADKTENVIKVYYRLINYTIEYDLDNGTLEEQNPENYNVKTEGITLHNPQKLGYTFLGWTGTGLENPTENVTIPQGSIGNREYTANWRANTDIEYTVEHYIENLDKTTNDYSLYQTQTDLIGTTDSTVTAEPLDIEGFEYDEEESSNTISGTVVADGSLVLKVFYSRKSYKLKLEVGDYVDSVTNGGTTSTTSVEKEYKYEQIVDIEASLSSVTGYATSWKQWNSSDSNVSPASNSRTTTIQIPAKDIILTANAKIAKSKFTYTVEYYYEDENGDFVIDEDKTFTSTPVEYETQVTTYQEKLESGYKLYNVDTIPLRIGAVSSENIIKVYYELEDYSIEYELNEGILESGKTNPTAYTIKSENIKLNNPEREGYIFKGWTGGVINENDETGTSGSVTIPSINLTIEKGSKSNRKYTANWEKRAYEVVVHHYLQGTTTELAPDEILTSDEIGTAYETASLIPTYDEQGNITNQDQNQRNYIDGKEYRLVETVGNVSGQFDVDPIEVIYYYQHYPVVTIISSPATDLVGNEYVSISDALEALKEEGLNVNSTLSKLKVLRDINNENVVVNGLNAQLDLNGFTVKSSSETEPTVKLSNSKFAIIDTTDLQKGKLISENATGVYIGVDSEFTLGLDEKPILETPEIIAAVNGIKKEMINNEQGILNFFDGKITAATAIDGIVNTVPIKFKSSIVEDGENSLQIATLKKESDAEARIGRTNYQLLENAIAAANTIYGTDGSQVEIFVLKDLNKQEKVVIDSTKNIKLNLDGNTITNNVTDYVLENKGKLEICDSQSENDVTQVISLTDVNLVNAQRSTTSINNTKDINFDLNITNDDLIYELDITGNYLTRDFIVELDGESIFNMKNSESAKETVIKLGELSKGTHNIRFYSSTSTNGPDFYTFTLTNSKGRIISKTSNTILNTVTTGELTLTSGKIGIGTSGKNAITNNGKLTIGSTNPNKVAPVIYSMINSTYLIENNGEVTINNGKLIEYSGVSTYGIKSKGSMTINNGEVTTNNTSIQYLNTTAENSTIVINGGTFKNTVQNNSKAKLTINGGTFNGTVLNSYNVSSNQVVNMEVTTGTFNGEFTTNNYARTTVANGTFNKVAKCNGNGKLTVNNGNFYKGIEATDSSNISIVTANLYGNLKSGSSNAYINVQYAMIDTRNAGETNCINISSGTIDITDIDTYSASGCAINQTGGTVNITDGNFEASSAYAINKTNGTLNFYDGYVCSNTKSALYLNGTTGSCNIFGGTLETKAANTYAICNNTTGTINIGNNQNAISTSNPQILALNGCGITNRTGTVNFYDGMIKCLAGNEFLGVISEIPTGAEIIINSDSTNSNLEIATLGTPTRAVAQIGTTQYYSLYDAIRACNNNVLTTIEIIDDVYESKKCEITSNQNIIINMNDYNINLLTEDSVIENNGKLVIQTDSDGTNDVKSLISSDNKEFINNKNELTIKDIKINSKLYSNSSSKYLAVIVNEGTLNINKSYIDATDGNYINTIYNKPNGECILTNVELNCKTKNTNSIISNRGIYNESQEGVVVNGGKIYANMGVYNTNNGKIELYDVDMKPTTSGYYSAIYSDSGNITIDEGNYVSSNGNALEIVNGEVSISDATISGKYGIYISGDAEVTCTNVDITGSSQCIYNKSADGTVTITNSLTNKLVNGIYNEGTVSVTGGEYNQSAYNGSATNNKANASITLKDVKMTFRSETTNAGTMDIISGTLTSTANNGIKNSGTLTIGKKGGDFSTTDPMIIGATYGVYNESNATFNFYDGRIKGSKTNSIYGTITSQEDGYERIIDYDSTDNRQISILGALPIAKIGDTEYDTIADAVNNYQNGQTIVIIRDATLSKDTPSVTTPSGKTVTIDLDGHNISAGNINTFITDGNLELTDSQQTGSFINTSYSLIKMINTSNITLTNVAIGTNGQTYTVDENTYTVYSINNEGTGNITIDNSKITAGYGIRNEQTGNISITNGSQITCSVDGIQNNGNGNIEVTNSTFSGTNNCAIDNMQEGKITVYSGTINSKLIGIRNNNGEVTIKNVSMDCANAINNIDGTVTIEANNNIQIKGGKSSAIVNNGIGTVDIYGGTISGTRASGYGSGSGTDNGHGILVKSGTVNVYNGTIQSNGGYSAVNRNGELNVYNGTFKNGIFNNTSKTMNIEDGNFEDTIENKGELIISGGTYTIESGSGAIIKNDDATAQTTVTGGQFTGYSLAFDNRNGTMDLSGITVETTNTGSTVIKNASTLDINNVTVTTDASNSTGINNTGTVNLKNSTIQLLSEGTIGIFNTGTINMGKNDNIIDDNYVKVEATEIGIDSHGTSAVFNFYDGTIKGKDAFRGEEQNLPANTRVYIDENGETKIATLINSFYVAQIGSTQYKTLQDAVDDIEENQEEATTIKIISDFVTTNNNITTIGENQKAIIDLNGHTINNYGKLFVNDGSLKIVDNYTGVKGSITGDSKTLIDNTGNIELAVDISQDRNNKFINNTSSGSIKITSGTITVNDDNQYYNNIVIYNSGNGEISVLGGNITFTNGITVSSSYKSMFIDTTSSTPYTSIIISNASITGEKTGESEEIYGIYSRANSDITIFSGTLNVINPISVTNGKLEIVDGNIISTSTTDTRNAVTLDKTTFNMVDGDISIDYGRGLELKNTSTANIKGGYISSEYGVGILITSGTVTLDDERALVSTTLPEISGGTYGVQNNGTLNFYDGKIIGLSTAISGNSANIPTSYEIEYSSGETIATLDRVSTYTQPISMNNSHYDTLQTAINVAGTSVVTIRLEDDIILENAAVINANQTITIDLNSHSIVGTVSDYAIINNGNLTIIDSTVPANNLEIDTKATVDGRVVSAIYNTGILTLGIDDGNVYTNTPTIIGEQYGIENHGTFNIYDGRVKGKTAPLDNAESVSGLPSGYTVDFSEQTDNGFKILKLKSSD